MSRPEGAAQAYAHEKQLQRLNDSKNALLETLALAYQRYDKGTIDQELFGLVLERLQHFLEAEAEVEAGVRAGAFTHASMPLPKRSPVWHACSLCMEGSELLRGGVLTHICMQAPLKQQLLHR